MSEEDPQVRLKVNNEEYDMTRRNSALFMHAGELSMYDHVFVQAEPIEDDADPFGVYIFRLNHNFEVLAEFMIKNCFTRHIDLTGVAECDRDAFDKSFASCTSDIEDGWPEDWDTNSPPE